MKRPTVGLQIYTFNKEYFWEGNPLDVLKQIKAMGYDAVELYNSPLFHEAEQVKHWLDEAGLPCCSMMVDWVCTDDDKFRECIRHCKIIGCDRLIIASAVAADLKKRDKLPGIIDRLKELQEMAKAEGIYVGYHAHFSDFFMVDGVSSFDRIMQGTPDDFGMIIDTGNLLSADVDCIHYFNKYPNRSPVVHLKPFDKKISSGSTMIGEDSFDWPKLIDTCIDVGGADTLVVEYASFNRFKADEAAQLCYDRLNELLDRKYK